MFCYRPPQMWCCEDEKCSRVILLSKNNQFTSILWQKLTKSKSQIKLNQHNEQNIFLNGKKISLCTVENNDPELWELNAKHSEGVILIAELDEVEKPEFSIFIEENSRHNMLVLCHTSNIGDGIPPPSKGNYLKYQVCDVIGGKGVDQGLDWLSQSIQV